ncbi:DUF1800 domain-containing protein [Flavobacterium stagni]|uniref:DUF1800 domain-containing protein n=1 Tax=Flavobacterium stagni TaxID=2506421 RepID=A0A4Q1K8M0_9FLAO|nr:DUF1800 domain-containing protein [Flavobacterium stagni]RXR22541.1 DUF1800 domain-containing protein [Flavobacterium stagni]
MELPHLWSLRLGFSNRQAPAIQALGMESFLKKAFKAPFSQTEPECLKDDPKSLLELREKRQQFKNGQSEEAKKLIKEQIQKGVELKQWWLQELLQAEFPLREKMVLFWHNHFVATSQKVKVNWWIYQHNQLLREMAFGNFKTLTKAVIQTNAMVRYLDNVDNKRGEINENLSRELLELFTLGIGNYTEEDIKNGAKALAGLNLGESKAQYRPRIEDNDTITYLGKTGHFKADDLVDQIFEQPKIPYLITRKILKWFIYDTPDEKLVTYYGDYFRKVNFEIQPLLLKIFTEEYAKPTAGSKIKNPLEFIAQLHDELQIKMPNIPVLVFFLRQQGMDLFNQPNVKGWDGGTSWLTSQIYLQRQNSGDLLCSGRLLNRRIFKDAPENGEVPKMKNENLNISIAFSPTDSNVEIIQKLSNRLLFQVSPELQKDMESVLKYDFDGQSANAQQAVIRLFNYIIKTPEFQLI